jgi:signal transduction histidine kinase
MSSDEKLERRVFGAFAIGIFVAMVDFVLDVSLVHSTNTPATTVLNDLIIGTAAGLFAYFWMARQAAKNARELATQKLMEKTVHRERKRIAMDLHDTVCQAQAAAIMQLECAGDSLDDHSGIARQQVLRALQLLRGSMTEMRCALWDLYPEEKQKVHLKGDQGFDCGKRSDGAPFPGWNHARASTGNRERLAKNQPGSAFQCRKTCPRS